jgi:hypothetical protein
MRGSSILNPRFLKRKLEDFGYLAPKPGKILRKVL